ncbi:hypothetical protein H696_03490 [Fonticula alba]|uniref:WW domain-containing protein n=1 Tax=Fonticula alba TaxID=691883 RepID=A0A058Z802_FONAL|nr:hypothetical protein H696_03490 [Fonticula alba]KCV70023.1 hypothetical protein H696_03490 [Fonticula alba]|eukprot:XP_009495629.1 hypothetical protein H696_03490 [Fonticula alba]
MSGPDPSQIASSWAEYKSATGRPYYYNSITKESVFQRPDALRTAEELASPWRDFTTEEGKVYFHNRETKETLWDPPADFAGILERAGRLPKPASTAPTPAVPVVPAVPVAPVVPVVPMIPPVAPVLPMVVPDVGVPVATPITGIPLAGMGPVGGGRPMAVPSVPLAAPVASVVAGRPVLPGVPAPSIIPPGAGQHALAGRPTVPAAIPSLAVPTAMSPLGSLPGHGPERLDPADPRYLFRLMLRDAYARKPHGPFGPDSRRGWTWELLLREVIGQQNYTTIPTLEERKAEIIRFLEDVVPTPVPLAVLNAAGPAGVDVADEPDEAPSTRPGSPGPGGSAGTDPEGPGAGQSADVLAKEALDIVASMDEDFSHLLERYQDVPPAAYVSRLQELSAARTRFFDMLRRRTQLSDIELVRALPSMLPETHFMLPEMLALSSSSSSSSSSAAAATAPSAAASAADPATGEAAAPAASAVDSAPADSGATSASASASASVAAAAAAAAAVAAAAAAARLEKDISGSMPIINAQTKSNRWRSVAEAFRADPAFLAVEPEDLRRLHFERYLAVMQHYSRVRAKRQEEDLRRRFQAVLESLPNFSIESRFNELQPLWLRSKAFMEDSELQGLSKLQQLTFYREIMEPRLRREVDKLDAERRAILRRDRKNRDAFRGLLEEMVHQGKIEATTRWEDVYANIRQSHIFRAMLSNSSGSQPLDLFFDQLARLVAIAERDREAVEAILQSAGFVVTAQTPSTDFFRAVLADRRGQDLKNHNLRFLFEDLRQRALDEEADRQRLLERRRRGLFSFLRSNSLACTPGADVSMVLAAAAQAPEGEAFIEAHAGRDADLQKAVAEFVRLVAEGKEPKSEADDRPDRGSASGDSELRHRRGSRSGSRSRSVSRSRSRTRSRSHSHSRSRSRSRSGLPDGGRRAGGRGGYGYSSRGRSRSRSRSHSRSRSRSRSLSPGRSAYYGGGYGDRRGSGRGRLRDSRDRDFDRRRDRDYDRREHDRRHGRERDELDAPMAGATSSG